MWKWKRVWKCCALLYVGLFCLPILTAASAACGTAPPLPPEGLIWPVSGSLTSGWTLDCQTDTGHRGIDIDAAASRPVSASASGTVIFAGYTPAEGGGTTVSLEHAGGIRTTYLHLTQLAVASGQQVSQGQTLGLTNGNALHFGIKVNEPRELYFNPLLYLPPPEPSAGSMKPAGSAEAVASTAPAVLAPADPIPALPSAPVIVSTPTDTVSAPATQTGQVIDEATLRNREPSIASTYPYSLSRGETTANILDPGRPSSKPAFSIPVLGADGWPLLASLHAGNAGYQSDVTDHRDILGRMAPLSWRGLALAILLLLMALAGRAVGKMSLDTESPEVLF